MTQLRDVKNHLVNKIESRFKELTNEVSKNVRVKRKAIEGRKSNLDRFYLQVRKTKSRFINVRNLSIQKVNSIVAESATNLQNDTIFAIYPAIKVQKNGKLASYSAFFPANCRFFHVPVKLFCKWMAVFLQS